MFYSVKIKKGKIFGASTSVMRWEREGACCLFSAQQEKNDERAILKGVLKTKNYLYPSFFYLPFNIMKIFVFMCKQKTNISSQIDLYIKQSLDQKQTEITGMENRDKHTRLSRSKMRQMILKAVSMKIAAFWNTAHCCLLSKILFRILLWRYKLEIGNVGNRLQMYKIPHLQRQQSAWHVSNKYNRFVKIAQ
jgi:hypothetical protein